MVAITEERSKVCRVVPLTAEQADLEVKADDRLEQPGERQVLARISTIEVDRDGDVMLPSGMQTDEYEKNPVVLLAHDAGRLPIGKAVTIRKRRNDVLAVIEFAGRPDSLPAEAEHVPDTVLDLFRQKILQAFSVGFRVPSGGVREPTRGEMAKWPGVRQVVTEWDLLEVSVVPVPANQSALAMRVGTKSWLGKAWHLEVDKPDRLVVDFSRPVVRIPKPITVPGLTAG